MYYYILLNTIYSGPGHDLTAPCALDFCVTEYGISPVLGRSENKSRDEEEEEEEERVHYFCFQYGIRSSSCLQRRKRQITKTRERYYNSSKYEIRNTENKKDTSRQPLTWNSQPKN